MGPIRLAPINPAAAAQNGASPCWTWVMPAMVWAAGWARRMRRANAVTVDLPAGGDGGWTLWGRRSCGGGQRSVFSLMCGGPGGLEAGGPWDAGVG